MSDLRKRTIRLAYANPDLRPHLLSALKSADFDPEEIGEEEDPEERDPGDSYMDTFDQGEHSELQDKVAARIPPNFEQILEDAYAAADELPDILDILQRHRVAPIVRSQVIRLWEKGWPPKDMARKIRDWNASRRLANERVASRAFNVLREVLDGFKAIGYDARALLDEFVAAMSDRDAHQYLGMIAETGKGSKWKLLDEALRIKRSPLELLYELVSLMPDRTSMQVLSTVAQMQDVPVRVAKESLTPSSLLTYLKESGDTVTVSTLQYAFPDYTSQQITKMLQKLVKEGKLEASGSGRAKKYSLSKTASRYAGCEKLPEGPMRDNCEKKKDEGGEDKTAALRKATIRLAHENPSLRPHLLPLLKEANYNETVHERVQRALQGNGITSPELAVALVLDQNGMGHLPGYTMNGPKIPQWDASFRHPYRVEIEGLGTFIVNQNGRVKKASAREAGYAIDFERGMVPTETMHLQEDTVYWMGASRSPKQIIVTGVSPDTVQYLVVDYGGKHKKVREQRWVAEDLIRKGSKTWLGTYGKYHPEQAKSIRAMLAGRPGKKVNVRKYLDDLKRVDVTAVAAPAYEGQDLWRAAETYGGVGSRVLGDGTTAYVILTDKRLLRDLEQDDRFEILQVKDSR